MDRSIWPGRWRRSGADTATRRCVADRRCWRATRTADGPATSRWKSRATPCPPRRGGRAPTAPSRRARLIGLRDDAHRLPAAASRDRRARPPLPGRAHRAEWRGPRIAGSRDPRAEGDRRGGTASVPWPCPRLRRTGAGPGGVQLAAAAGAERLAAIPYYGYHAFGVERRRAEVIRRVAGRAAWFEDRRPAARRGLRPADGAARPRTVDRGRSRRPSAGRRRRGECRRLPPPEPGRLGAGRGTRRR